MTTLVSDQLVYRFSSSELRWRCIRQSSLFEKPLNVGVSHLPEIATHRLRKRLRSYETNAFFSLSPQPLACLNECDRTAINILRGFKPRT